MSTIEAKLRKAFPQLDQGTRGLAALAGYQTRDLRSREEQLRVEMADEVLRLARAGEAVPDDIAAPILAERDRLEMLILRSYAIDNARLVLAGEGTAARRELVQPMLAQLRVYLADLVARAREAANDLQGARDADRAVASGDVAVTAWRQLPALAAEYDEIRALQKELLTTFDPDLTSTLEDSPEAISPMMGAGLYADSLYIHPYWAERRRLAFQSSVGTKIGSPALRQWMADGEAIEAQWKPAQREAWTRTWWPTRARETHLLWILENTNPWIPDPDVMRAAHQAAFSASTPVPKKAGETGSGRVASITEYAELTGTAMPAGIQPSHREPSEPRRLIQMTTEIN